jgi:hypothetical protein
VSDAAPLICAFERLGELEGLGGSHVSIDRDRFGEESITIVPDWIDGVAVGEVLALCRELELEAVLCGDGLRLAHHMNSTSRGVAAVKKVLAGEDDEETDEE